MADYEQIRQGLRNKPEPVHDPELRHGMDWIRFSVTWLGMAVAYAAAWNVVAGNIPGWFGGIVVLVAAGACWVVEAVS